MEDVALRSRSEFEQNSLQLEEEVAIRRATIAVEMAAKRVKIENSATIIAELNA